MVFRMRLVISYLTIKTIISCCKAEICIKRTLTVRPWHAATEKDMVNADVIQLQWRSLPRFVCHAHNTNPFQHIWVVFIVYNKDAFTKLSVLSIPVWLCPTDVSANITFETSAAKSLDDGFSLLQPVCFTTEISKSFFTCLFEDLFLGPPSLKRQIWKGARNLWKNLEKPL